MGVVMEAETQEDLGGCYSSRSPGYIGSAVRSQRAQDAGAQIAPPASFGADEVEGSRGEAMSWAEPENIPAQGGCSSTHSCPGTDARLSEVL